MPTFCIRQRLTKYVFSFGVFQRLHGISFVEFSKVSTLDSVFEVKTLSWALSPFSCKQNVYRYRKVCVLSRKRFCINGARERQSEDTVPLRRNLTCVWERLASLATSHASIICACASTHEWCTIPHASRNSQVCWRRSTHLCSRVLAKELASTRKRTREYSHTNSRVLTNKYASNCKRNGLFLGLFAIELAQKASTVIPGPQTIMVYKVTEGVSGHAANFLLFRKRSATGRSCEKSTHMPHIHALRCCSLV